MIARVARLGLMAEALVYVLMAVWLSGKGVSPLRIFALVVGMALLLRLLVTLGPFALVLCLRLRDRKAIRPLSWLSAIAGEYQAKSLSFTLYQPFEPWIMAADPEPVSGGPLPVLLVHGYLCNRASWLVLRRLLGERLPNPLFTISLEPPLARIDDYVSQLDARVTAILAGSGHARLHLVCHSMGGLVARAWMLRSAGRDKVASLSMLGSPHHGTELARAGIGHNVKQMVKSNQWLQKLEEGESVAPPRVPALSLFTENDNLVYPPESSALPWATNVRIEGVGHVQLQSSAKVADFVADAIRKAGTEG